MWMAELPGNAQHDRSGLLGGTPDFLLTGSIIGNDGAK
jgi:hypothetical protein